MVKVQTVDVKLSQSPPQSWKSAVAPEAETAVSETLVFCDSATLQPGPPAVVHQIALLVGLMT